MDLNHYVYLSTGPHWKLLHMLRELLHILSFKPSHCPHLHPHWGPYWEHLCHSFFPQGPAFTCGSYWSLEPGRGLPLSHSSKMPLTSNPVRSCATHTEATSHLSTSFLCLWILGNPIWEEAAPPVHSLLSSFSLHHISETVLENSSLVHLYISVCYIQRYFCSSHFKLDMVSITSKNNNENGREF